MNLYPIVNPTSLKNVNVSAPVIVRALAAARSHNRIPAAIGRLVIGPIASLLTLSPMTCLGEEAWWLEMPRPIHEALMKRICAGNEKELAAALARLPEMVKSGQVREIEKLTEGPDGKACPVHGKEQTILNEDSKFLILGSYYTAHPKMSNGRLFRTRTEGTGLGADVRVVTQAKLGNTWQVTFCVVEGQVSRLLLEKNPKSAQASINPSAVLNVVCVGERHINVSWFYTHADDQFVSDQVVDWQKGSLQAGCGPEFSDSVDTRIAFKTSHREFMSLGCVIRCMALRGERMAVDAIFSGAALSQQGIFRRGNGQLVLDNAAGLAKSNFEYVDYYEDSGRMMTDQSEKSRGCLEASLIRISGNDSSNRRKAP